MRMLESAERALMRGCETGRAALHDKRPLLAVQDCDNRWVVCHVDLPGTTDCFSGKQSAIINCHSILFNWFIWKPVYDIDFYFFITGSIAAVKTPVFGLPRGPFWGFSPPRGWHVAPIGLIDRLFRAKYYPLGARAGQKLKNLRNLEIYLFKDIIQEQTQRTFAAVAGVT